MASSAAIDLCSPRAYVQGEPPLEAGNVLCSYNHHECVQFKSACMESMGLKNLMSHV